MIVVEKATLVALVYSWFGDPVGVVVAPLRGYASESYERKVLAEVGKTLRLSHMRRQYANPMRPTGSGKGCWWCLHEGTPRVAPTRSGPSDDSEVSRFGARVRREGQ